MAKSPPKKWNFRDVSSGLQKLREFLIGRKHVFHNRFPPLISPRSIPPPDVPRGPEYKYSNQWYGKRNALDSVKPPVVAPIAEGRPKSAKKSYPCGGKQESDSVSFVFPPTPGLAWWFDGHCYYEYIKPTCPPPPPPPPPDPCAPPSTRASPCPQEKAQDTPSRPCDPCSPQPPKTC